MSCRLLQRTWPWRWTRTLLAAARKVWLHPTALLFGSAGRFSFGSNVRVGARSLLDTGSSGTLCIGDNVWISSDVEMQTSTKIAIGRGTSIQRRCTINGTSRIGAGCIFAPNVFVSSGTHPFRAFPHLPIREQERRISLSRDPRYDSIDRAIWIQADCWLGANVVVCPGVTIGKGSIIGANSVVTRDVRPYSIFAGSPANSIGVRLTWSPPDTLDAADEGHEIYVLDGERIKGSDGLYGFTADSRSARFVAALFDSGSASRIRIAYRAAMASRIAVAGRELSLEKGSGVLEFAAAGATGQGHFLFEIRLLSPVFDSAFLVDRVSLVTEP